MVAQRVVSPTIIRVSVVALCTHIRIYICINEHAVFVKTLPNAHTSYLFDHVEFDS